MHRSAAALAAALFAALVLTTSAAVAEDHGACPFAARVVDRLGHAGTIVSSSHNLCIVRYPDGHILAWTSANLRRAAGPPSAGASPATTANSAQPRLITPPASGAPAAGPPGVTVLRSKPSPPAGLVLRADRGGHFWVTAKVDGTPIRFLVDTGANVVTLNLADAAAAGFRPDDLVFDREVETANGRTRAAVVQLRQIELNGATMPGVIAAVVKTAHVSVLGMNFLLRLKHFEINGKTLTLGW